ncbi:uncharacterized protein LOC116840397 isoform X1 [Odontomachus brunneus]|uniref:uncharacterized protein LOC116840397 isoform X1 n=1 Tax=Odontomachus brunneus TaxID=486640 RepID=UPI0013F18321|nr:uncharacterized protein LOC116840397 isoform X1 [Odontomachus brunneus]XP_032662939.1 uncharacterized protein LOC116840397 isoform X1 [Odontomachus brunneus]XP_032662940.1 uncharacterized protein LOC116840397 isoform X1 [Odontomachus brunneus]XP_032662941.1 uncharacterized protein LOC116840397 isoform X1 [Odontomachus brunneus]
MADTSQQALSEPHTNGVMDGLTEEEKSKMRPADIDADMREMERRKRVEMMMNSRIFREELERIIETQMKDGAGPSGLLQQISDMMGAQGARFNGNVFKNSNCVLPINDIRGVESMGYAKGEKLLRCKLAAVFRLLDLYGWTQGVGGQITARLNQDQEHFLVNPYGLLYHEVTASSLIKVDMQGAVVEQGTTNFGVHVTGFQLHSTIHAARPDIKCIIHITTPSVTAISSLKCGLLPIGQESIVIGEVSSHQYIGGSVEPEEREKIARNLGPINKVMLLTNRGALCCGETVEEAFFNVYNTVVACETQLKLMPAGVDNLNLISEESKKAIFEASRKPPSPQQQSTAVESSALAEKLEKRWRIGGAEFEALMRMLDNAGFRTGYIYRNPLVKGEPPRPRNDVEVPPAVSSLGYLLEEEELYKQGLWKGGRKGTDRSRWLNSPNVYQKVEILETGTPDPKKITKWVSDGSPTHSSTPVKIDSALQFVPKNTNPKEFKQIQQQIKDYRRADKISAGPQSHILEGVSWEEAKKMQDATISGTGEQVVLVGAASKGIIQRGFQHNAMVYKTPYAKNPFDAVTDQELDQYKRDIERKQKGDPYDESQSESEALSSFNISRATHESSTAKSPIQSPVSVTSETEEESRDEPRVLRIETKQVPAPSQPEVVLSDVHDATTEFLNEMRRSRTIEQQSDYKGDCELSSSYSSASSERMRMLCIEQQFCESLYHPLHLENVRITTTAERKKPVLITCSRTLADDQSTESQSIDEFFKSRYEKRRQFFRDLEDQQAVVRSTTLSEVVRTNNDEDIREQNSTVKPSEETHLHHVKMYDAHGASTNLKELKKESNDEMCSSNVTIYPVEWKNITQAASVKVVNVKETEQSSYDIATSRTNGDNQVEDKTKHHEEIEYRNSSVEEAVPVVKQSQTIPENNEESNVSIGATFDVAKEQQQTIMTAEEVTLIHIYQPFQKDNNNEENLQPLNDILSDNYSDKHPVSHDECHENADVVADKDKETSNEETNDNVALKKRNIRSWVESSMCENECSHNKETSTYESHDKALVKITKSVDENIVSSRTDLNALSNTNANNSSSKIELDDESDTLEWYYDDIVKMVENMDANIATSRTELDALPNTGICTKYNLDSTNMSLIYSLTPSIVIDEEGSSNEDDTSRDLAERSSDWNSDATKSDASDALGDYIWMESIDLNAKPLDCPCDREAASDSSSYELEQPELEKHSTSSGSDILELPSHTVLELSEIDGKVFHNGINESTNEIIADLNASDETTRYDALQIARCIVAEITECVYVLSYFDSSIYNLGLVREVVRYLLDNYQYECSLLTDGCLPDQTCVSSNNMTMSTIADDDNDDDSICQMKGFLGNSSPNPHRDDQSETRQQENSSSAVIEFCTVARRLPIVAPDDETLELNFRVVKAATDRSANNWLNTPAIGRVENSIHRVDHDLLISAKNLNKSSHKRNVVVMRSDIKICDWCESCSCCCGEDDSIISETNRLTPIDEEPNEATYEHVDDCPTSTLLENSNDDNLSCQLKVHLVDENSGNPARKTMSLDDTYTISEYSDNDERSDPREPCDDIWDSVDCMSCSYDTKEFIRLEKTIVEGSRLNA